MNESSNISPLEQKLVEIQQLLDSYVDRRLAGDAITDDQILESHPELMPELESELGTLKTIERARRRARVDQQTVASGSSVFADDGMIEMPREKFPGYELRGEIHRGGQGVVHRALHLPTKREVAIKVLYGGSFAGGSELARFEREVQILASLRHPNIVTVHDSGVAPGGSMYFAMDFIDGAPLDLHFDATAYPPAQRLNDVVSAFVQICDAVNAAHLRGVIHRDLKPSNIRVDKEGRPQVLDFGLAKLIDFDEEADKTLNVNNTYTMTAQGQFVGSVPWASPEQASGEIDLDVRTDVYSIGVLLYQLTTGAFPYDVRGPIDEVISRIRSAAPASLQSRNAHIPTDLETIVLKALAKERERRYQSAGELRDDLARFLANEPVEARRDSGLYLARKLFARHRWAVGVGAAFFVLMTAAAIIASALYAGQIRERTRAEKQTEIASQERDTARAARAESDAVVEFMQNMLGEAGSAGGRKSDVTMREVLDAAAGRIEKDFDEQPLVRAALHDTVGAAYGSIALFDSAVPHLEAALELRRAHMSESDPLLSESMCELAAVLFEKGKNEEAMRLYEEALQRRQASADAGASALPLARAYSYLGSSYHNAAQYKESESAFLKSLEIFGEDKSGAKQWGTVYSDYGYLLMDLGRIEEAEPMFQKAHDIWVAQYGPVHTNVAGAIQNLGAVRHQLGDRAGALALTREALDMQRELLPHDHPAMASLLNNVGALAFANGDLDAAEKCLAECLEIYQTIHSEPHADTARAMTMLGVLKKERGENFEAEQIFQNALKVQQALLGNEHPDIAATFDLIAGTLESMRRLPEAEAAQRHALEIYRRAFTAPHLRIAAALSDLGSIQVGMCDDASAEASFREALNMMSSALPEGHKATCGPLGMLADLCIRRGNFVEAERLARQSFAIREEHFSWHWTYADAMVGIGVALLGQGDLAEAREWLDRAYVLMLEREEATPDERFVEIADANADWYTEAGKSADAAMWNNKGDEYRERILETYQSYKSKWPGVFDPRVERSITAGGRFECPR